MTKKRGHLLPRADVERDAREPVVIQGTCQIGDRPPEDVLVIDLGLSGCCLRGEWLGVTKSEPLTLHIADLGPIAAKLKWARKGSLGVGFDEPLTRPALQRLCAAPQASLNVVPLRRRPASR